jgi:hypothetical protein
MRIDYEACDTIAAVLAGPTTPDSVDWVLVPDGEDVYCAAMQERDGAVFMRRGWGKLTDLKATIEALPAHNNLGLVQLIVCSDAIDDAADLMCWLRIKAREKNFNFVFVNGPATTREAVTSMDAYKPSLRRGHPTPAEPR